MTRQRTTAELLDLLLDFYGLGSRDVARLIGARPISLPQWRAGQPAGDDMHVKLRDLADFLYHLEANGVEDPAAWLETPLPLPAGYRFRPLDYYNRFNHSKLTAVALGQRSAEKLLDELHPDWRDERSDNVVIDGSIVPRPAD